MKLRGIEPRSAVSETAVLAYCTKASVDPDGIEPPLSQSQ